MLIALDYDETYTVDPYFLKKVIELGKERGHLFICATMRYESEGEEIILNLKDKVEAIIFTGRKAKMLEVNKQGYYPSVWIDDSPLFLFEGVMYG